ncbi:hypothetical protein DL98DRAFT_517810 [Cadophora sp. DSE1049]|nr:hypothetical protein DL98DRAFT_517810 [Cadophora sp. DSE1049]
MFGGSNSSEYTTTSETSPGHGDVGSLSSDTNSLGSSVSPPPSRQTLDFHRREGQDLNAVYSYTPSRGDLEGIPRSFGQNGEANICGSSPTFLGQQIHANGPFMDLNEKNLDILHPHLAGREPLPEIEEWLQRRKCSGKAISTEESVKDDQAMKSRNGEKSSVAPTQDAENNKLKTQHVPDSSGKSRTEHRQIGEQRKTRQHNTATDDEDSSEDWKEM